MALQKQQRCSINAAKSSLQTTKQWILTKANPLFHLLSLQKIIKRMKKPTSKYQLFLETRSRCSPLRLSCATVQECLCYTVSDNLFYLL